MMNNEIEALFYIEKKGLCCCFTLAIIIHLGILCTLGTFLKIYAYDNPDREAWLGHISVEGNSLSLQMGLYASEQDLKAANATSNIHVHARLVAWFTWGFWNNILPIVIGAVFLFLALINPAVSLVFQGVFGCLSCCSSISWFITGIIWRWSADT